MAAEALLRLVPGYREEALACTPAGKLYFKAGGMHFNLWVKGTKLEKPENRHVGEIAQLLLGSGAYHYMKNMLTRMGADPSIFQADILEAYLK